MPRALLLRSPLATAAAASYETSSRRPAFGADPAASVVRRRRRDATTTRNRILASALGDDDEGYEYEFTGSGPTIEDATDALSPIANWLRSPTDVLSFGPRAALGALLSLPKAQERISAAAERAQELLQDPRPPLERGVAAARAAAEDLASLVEAGAGAEAKAISAALDALPSEVTGSLPPEFLAAVERAAGGGGSTSTSTDDDGGGDVDPAPSPDDRAAEEAATLASAAARVAEAADALAAARRSGGGSVGMARLNAREARASLARALEQATSSPSPSESVAEASKLLDELDEALSEVAG